VQLVCTRHPPDLIVVQSAKMLDVCCFARATGPVALPEELRRPLGAFIIRAALDNLPDVRAEAGLNLDERCTGFWFPSRNCSPWSVSHGFHTEHLLAAGQNLGTIDDVLLSARAAWGSHIPKQHVHK
jgi:hypothetical protein